MHDASMMPLPLSRRSAELELLDLGVLPPAQLATNLDDLARLNRLPGGAAASADAIALLLDGAGGRVLDVGTGRADIPLRLAARGWSVVALDSDPEVLAIARRAAAADPAVEMVAGDGRSLPFPDAAFDVAHCSLLIHHLDRGEAVALLREMRRVARRGVVVNDLRRGWGPLLATAVAVAVLGRCRATRHDGLLSVRRAYTVDELDDLLIEAGLQVRHRSAAWMPRVVTVATR
jgi:SAM-dependent methyltransferase